MAEIPDSKVISQEEMDNSTSQTPSTVPANEQATTKDFSATAAAENLAPEKIVAAGKSAIEKFGVTRKNGVGRPRNCPACNADGKNPSGCEECNYTGKAPNRSALEFREAIAPSPAAPPVARIPVVDVADSNPVNRSLTRRAIGSTVKTGLRIGKKIIRSKCRRAGFDETFTNSVVAECENGEKEALAEFEETLGIVCEKYKWETKYAPEAALVAAILEMGTSYGSAIGMLNEEIARRKKLDGVK